MRAGGEIAVIRNSATAATPTMPNRRAADMGGLASALTAGAAAAGATAGAAETATGGGGQVFSPSRTTVIERWTTSSKSSTSVPSFSGVSSFMRLTRLVP